MVKSKEFLSINEKENWGNLVDPRGHAAAIGLRLADNRRRNFQMFSDRCTVVGDRDVAVKAQKWLYSRKTMNAIKRNTSFAFGVDDRNCWATTDVIGRNKDIHVTIDVTCSGEYCYVRVYADRLPSLELNVESAFDKERNHCWAVVFPSMGIRGPLIYAKTRIDAMKAFQEYLANELVAADSIGEPDGW